MTCGTRAHSRWLGSFALLTAASLSALVGAAASGSSPRAAAASVIASPHCPWARPSAVSSSPDVLASRVVAKMTLAEKIGVVDLAAAGGYENRNAAVARLCIPALTLQDSPNGIAFGAKGVTQLPAPLGLAASFDPLLAYRYGRVEGEEARGKGIDVVQGPELNLDRVPESGRAFEAFGEDPNLTAAMGVADIEGIQSTGVMADAKHYTAYNQETARLVVNQVVPQRALTEIYQLPFQAAVEQAHVASIMCAYGALNGVNDCSSRPLYRTLAGWGFKGFVRSDLGAVFAPVRAFAAGMSMIKPAAGPELEAAIAHHRLSMRRLDDAVRRVLFEMFAFHVIEHPPQGSIGASVTSPAHGALAREVAEASIVLLKNAGAVLPLRRSSRTSVAVVGADAAAQTMSAGYGSARVVAPYVVTPLAGLRSALGDTVEVGYTRGGGAELVLPDIPASALVATRTLKGAKEPPALTGNDPEGVADLKTLRAAPVTRAVATATAPQRSKGWATWTGRLTPPKSGLYSFSLTQRGDTWLYLDDKVLFSSRGLHGPAPWSTAVHLVAGRHYALRLTWFEVSSEGEPRLGWAYDSSAIAAAARTARAASVAIVFVNDYTSEGVDRPNLSLPGDQDELISAVAAANPRTVVVLNTSGPVLMPWLPKVAAVLEAWYPGQEDGNAVAAVLTGRVDPSGHLPVTFPALEQAVPAHLARAWPGSDAVVSYLEGLDIGYRYDQTYHLRPLFAFGFGLSYTSFALSRLSVTPTRNGDSVRVDVRNTGRVAGRAVIQAYIAYPPGSGEPPEQLRAFTALTLAPGRSGVAVLALGRRAFQADVGGTLKTLPGAYRLSVGQSSADLGLSVNLHAP